MVSIRQLRPDEDLADLIELSRQFFMEYQAHHEAFFDINGLTDAHIAGYTATANAGAIQFYRQRGMQPRHTSLIGEIAPEAA